MILYLRHLLIRAVKAVWGQKTCERDGHDWEERLAYKANPPIRARHCRRCHMHLSWPAIVRPDQ